METKTTQSQKPKKPLWMTTEEYERVARYCIPSDQSSDAESSKVYDQMTVTIQDIVMGAERLETEHDRTCNAILGYCRRYFAGNLRLMLGYMRLTGETACIDGYYYAVDGDHKIVRVADGKAASWEALCARGDDARTRDMLAEKAYRASDRPSWMSEDDFIAAIDYYLPDEFTSVNDLRRDRYKALSKYIGQLTYDAKLGKTPLERWCKAVVDYCDQHFCGNMYLMLVYLKTKNETIQINGKSYRVDGSYRLVKAN